jgi:hypothetical protein
MRCDGRSTKFGARSPSPVESITSPGFFLFRSPVGFRPRISYKAPDASNGDTLSAARPLDKSPSRNFETSIGVAWERKHSGSG